MRLRHGTGAGRSHRVRVVPRRRTEPAGASAEGGGFRFIDLFAGIGGMRRGFEGVGGTCVFTCEWDKYAQQTYRANYDTDHPLADDIRDVNVGAVPEHDVLLAGFPCQPFSIAGVSKRNALKLPHGFRCKVQGTLFFDVVRILNAHRPRAFLLENVKNLVNHDKGRTFRIIHETLTQGLGYDVHWKVLDAKSWVPQHRERIFLAGFREPSEFSFDNLEYVAPSKGPRLQSILHPEDGSEDCEMPYTTGRNARVVDKYTLSDHLWRYLQSYAEKTPRGGERLWVRTGDTRRRLEDAFRKVLQGWIGDPRQARQSKPSAFDASRVRPPNGVRRRHDAFLDSGVGRTGLPTVRQCCRRALRGGRRKARGTLGPRADGSPARLEVRGLRLLMVDLIDWLNAYSTSGHVWFIKRLSGNDTLANRTHQAGPYVPKGPFRQLFPQLEESADKNPRVEFDLFIDSHAQHRQATIIWYKGGTRNETRHHEPWRQSVTSA